MVSLLKTCLTCLCKSSDVQSLNQILIDNLKIQEILHKIVPILLENQEFSLPEYICTQCLDKLVISYTFQKQCLDSVQNLYDLWSESHARNDKQLNMYKQEAVLEDKEHKGNEEVTRDTLTSNENKNFLEIQFEEITMDSVAENKEPLEMPFYQSYNDETEEDNSLGGKELEDNENGTEDKSQSEAKDVTNQCKVCKQIFKNPQGLALHETKAHFKNYPYNCDKCNKGFDAEEFFIKHNNRHLGIKTFKCPQCDKAFDANCTLNQHLISHSKETPYLCTICGKRFNRLSSLKQHMLRHGDENTFQCSVCPKSFKCLSDHITHMWTHNTEKRYECKICGVRLATNTSLKHHKLVHTGEKPFKCEQCDKCFNSLTNMRRHQRLHTGEKPYKCEFCEKAFCQSNDLKKHYKCVHNYEKNVEEHSSGDNSLHKDKQSLVFKQETEEDDDVEEDLNHSEDEDTSDRPTEDKVQPEMPFQQGDAGEEKLNDNLESQQQQQILLTPNKSVSIEDSSIDSNRCKLCKKVFKNSHGLAVHNMKTHLKKHLYKCDKCDRGFDSEEFYIKHYNLHLGIKPFQCTQCEKAFETRYCLNQHLISHSEEAPFSCSICGNNFRRKSILKQHHQRIHTAVKPHKCRYCKKAFSLESDLKKHKKRIHKKETIGESDDEEINRKAKQVVPEDNEHFSYEEDTMESLDGNKEDLKKEIEQMTERGEGRLNDKNDTDLKAAVDSNQCKLCQQVFKNPQGLAAHTTKAHLKKYLYNCDKCERGFDSEEFYIKHRNRHLGIKTFKCPQCGKAFDANSTLNQHLISHSKETPHLCTICGKSFNRAGTLKQHILRHGDEKPYQCSLCPKSFKCLSDQIIHMSKHKKEKRYVCKICGVRLATSTSLSHHKRVHSGAKPFKCDQCDKSFSSLSNMRSHRRIHTGEKPYSCQYCEKSFRQSNDRNKHSKRMHKQEIGDTKTESSEEKQEKEEQPV